MSDKKRVLAVDDDADVLRLVQGTLSRLGHDVTAVSGGSQALAWLAENPAPDLILLDVMMPGLSGLDVCRKLRETPATADTPVVFLTTQGQIQDVADARAAGSDLYLVKPLLGQKLATYVGMFLSRDGSLSRRPRS